MGSAGRRASGHFRGVGFHGKVPARGDFVGHGLPREVLEPWDGWLATALAETRRRLGGGWERCFAGAPVWRFALSAGLCGDAPLIGVLRPSADRVGRLYTFTIAAALPDTLDLSAAPGACTAWFTRAEAIATGACRTGADVEGLPARLALLGRPEPECPHPIAVALVRRLAGPLAAGSSLWWTRGGGDVEPSLLSCRGLPGGARPTAMLDGAWDRWGWEDGDVARG
ncbi:type VI secretion system-associated protein TagF [Azospirillum agricola]|uniref:type VI secretion system-associated protein TagF n=1 Tax=Azospirillum agricola TaxID=1720247 RepID=UPI000A1C8C0C|nr:type VI secretion system-associated protein TagF [Azospirillum agricola]